MKLFEKNCNINELSPPSSSYEPIITPSTNNLPKLKAPVNLSLPPNPANNQPAVKSKIIAGLHKLVIKKVSDKEDSLDVVSDEDSLFGEKTEGFTDEEESFSSDIFDDANHESNSDYSDTMSIQSSNDNVTGDCINKKKFVDFLKGATFCENCFCKQVHDIKYNLQLIFIRWCGLIQRRTFSHVQSSKIVEHLVHLCKYCHNFVT